MKKIAFLSSFWIKILAIIFMTLDHLGMYFAMQYPLNQTMIELSNVFRILGRLALPLFIFLIAEGVRHTKNFNKYMLKLGIIGSIISIVFILFTFTNLFPGATPIYRNGNIFIDLILTATAIYCLKHPNKKVKLLTLLPLIYSIVSFVVKGVEVGNTIEIHWFPYFLNMQYDWVSVLLGLGFYFSYKFSDIFIEYLEEKSGISKDIWIENGSYRFVTNLFFILVNVVVITAQFTFIYLWPKGVYWDAGIQLYAILSGALLLFYSGKRGYNAKWFQIGTYIYYPLHILIIAIIFIIQNGGL